MSDNKAVQHGYCTSRLVALIRPKDKSKNTNEDLKKKRHKKILQRNVVLFVYEKPLTPSIMEMPVL
ncbi:hypothetical protein ACTXT7_006364 [Hymenolepis weldensis]